MNNNPFDIKKVINDSQLKEIEVLKDRLWVHFRRQQLNEKLIFEFRKQCEALPENNAMRQGVEKMLQMFDDVAKGRLDGKPRPKTKGR